MKETDEKRIAAKLAKIMAIMCVRNTKLEELHSGKLPVTKAGDYSDVVVVDADGRKIPWTEVSHFDEDAMQELMRQIVNRIYTFQLKRMTRTFMSWLIVGLPYHCNGMIRNRMKHSWRLLSMIQKKND